MAVSAKQFDQLVKRVAGKSSKDDDASQSPAARKYQIIIGIDPSMRGTGYGVIQQVS